jgi:hypothetical protein
MACTPITCNAENTVKGHLLIRRNTSDTAAARPITPCTDFWTSPDIWLDPGDGSKQTSASEGQKVAVMVRVTNSGAENQTPKSISDINVEAWVCNYTLGCVGPTTALTPPGRFEGFVPGPVNAGSAIDVNCGDWTVGSGEVETNNGHLCLGANAWATSPNDGRALPSGGQVIPCCDSHHGQRNLQLIAVDAGDDAYIEVFLENPDGRRALNAKLEMYPARGEMLFGKPEREFILGHHQMQELVGPKALEGLELKRARKRPEDWGFEGKGIKPGKKTQVELKPKRSIKVKMRVRANRADRPGTVYVMDALTTDPRDRPIGGARLLVMVR